MAPRKPRPVITVKGHEYEVDAGDTVLTLGFAQAVAADIMGGMTLKKALSERKQAPAIFFRWMGRFDWLRALIMEAHEFRADMMADEIVDIADDRRDDMYPDMHHGGEKPNMAAVARAKLRVETRKHLMGKFNPRKYADKHVSLDEGIGGLNISWGGGVGIARMTRQQLKEIKQVGVITSANSSPAIIEGELVNRDGGDE